MKIDEAIEIQDRILYSQHFSFTSVEEEALKLGIEDLKRTKANRMTTTPIVHKLLPGETKE